MKGALHGIKVSRVVLILVSLVCATVLVLAWTKTTLLTSLIPSQIGILQFNRDSVKILEGPKSTDSKNQVESTESSNKESAVKGLNNKNTTAPKKKDSVEVREGPKISDARNKVALKGSSSIEPAVKGLNAKNTTTLKKKGCNYSKGKWVFDDSRPLYSGFGCKQWLSSMWACRLTQRTDFEYEKLRWKPKDCEMEEFTASNFLNRMRHKTLAFIGDSLGRQQFQSLMCMATAGEERPDVQNVGREYGLVKARGSIRPDGWAYRFPNTNTTILYYWSASLSDLVPFDPSNKTTEVAMHLDRPPKFLQTFMPKFHVIVLNTGHHWNKGKIQANRWTMHVGGAPAPGAFEEIDFAKNFTANSVVKWVDGELRKYKGTKAFFRSLSPRHFFNGDWNTGGTCDNITPPTGKEVLKESSDVVAAGAVKGTMVRLLDITGLSEVRDEGHMSRYSIRATTPEAQDCLHWCLPGVPDTWNEILFAQI